MEQVNRSWVTGTQFPGVRPSAQAVATGSAAILLLLIHFLIRDAALYVTEFAHRFVIPLATFYVILAIVFCRLRYTDFPRVFQLYGRVTALGILVYLLVERPGFTLVFPQESLTAAYVDWGSWIAIALSILSCWRVSFLFPVGFYCISTRFLAIPISGFEAPDLDIRYMMDLAQFMAFGAAATKLLELWQRRHSGASTRFGISLIDKGELAICITFIAIGLHLGNYFWSGYEKLVIGPYPWSWMLENQTQNLMLIGLKRGILPWPYPSAITQYVYDSFGSIVVLSNFFVVTTQLFAIVAVVRLRWLWIITIAYDLLHLGIYVFGGLFFWPWIWNNASILVAVRGQAEKQIGWLPRVCCIITVISGCDHSLGAAATLAWFDIREVKVPVIQAESEDGVWADVPVSFFLNHSQLIVMGLEDRTKAVGHYAPTIRGGVLDYERQKNSGKCLPPPVLDPETPQARELRLATLRKFIQAHHKHMLWLTSVFGRYIYYFHSHHQPSNPFLHKDFEAFDLQKIRAYRLVVQSICMDLKDGKLVEHEYKRDEYPLPLN